MRLISTFVIVIIVGYLYLWNFNFIFIIIIIGIIRWWQFQCIVDVFIIDLLHLIVCRNRIIFNFIVAPTWTNWYYPNKQWDLSVLT